MGSTSQSLVNMAFLRQNRRLRLEMERQTAVMRQQQPPPAPPQQVGPIGLQRAWSDGNQAGYNRGWDNGWRAGQADLIRLLKSGQRKLEEL